jgi:hypothetical protein
MPPPYPPPHAGEGREGAVAVIELTDAAAARFRDHGRNVLTKPRRTEMLTREPPRLSHRRHCSPKFFRTRRIQRAYRQEIRALPGPLRKALISLA